MQKIEIYTEYIKLDQFLKWVGIAETGAMAKVIIKSGDVYVNGVQTLERGKKIRKGDIIEVKNIGTFEVV
ncbi:ribosome-associated protein [Caloramator fervidus]|uniref:Ribosome-associated protein n=1 Tax=Caloramator fervidus TaxID=29344 RepID=A0A1H5WFF3_9CLOT|nr:RNA-binding S4 domain-containing protein [Caloramator fervidus]SEF97921.1 ribosome-associated protein [Caloramator fervidus]